MSHRLGPPVSHQHRLALRLESPAGGVLFFARVDDTDSAALIRRYLDPMEASSPLRPVPGAAVLEVWVVPGASRTEITGSHDGALRVRVAAPPAGGKANRALLRFLSKRLGCAVSLVRGSSSRRKQVRVECVDLDVIASALGIGPR